MKPARNKIVLQIKKKNTLYNYADVKEWTFNSFKWDNNVNEVL